PGQTRADLDDTLDHTIRLGANRVALFGYAHVPHMIPRQQRINADNLPGQEERFHMAEFGFGKLTAAGYTGVGFDHFALPGDPLAQAATSGRLRRNFQGFTDDRAQSVIGLGASSISSFPTLLAQNEKNAGRYRMLLSQDCLTASGGKARSVDDRRRGAVIEELLCRGRARIERALLDDAWPRLAPYVETGLCGMDNGQLVIEPHALPYARSIAACFDPYRQPAGRRFSSAV
ncbi:MAG: Coproporphyrinogen-III oxidase, anaerobic 1, partial [Pseudomonadota bacterium]